MQDPREPSPSLWTRIVRMFQRSPREIQFVVPSLSRQENITFPPFEAPPIQPLDLRESNQDMLRVLHDHLRQSQDPLSRLERTAFDAMFRIDPEEQRRNDELFRRVHEMFQRRAPESRERSQAWALRHQLAVRDSETNAGKLEPYPKVAIPDEFRCLISHDIMTVPAYDPRCPQHKFDLLVIRWWLNEEKQENPYTREPLQESDLVVDEALKAQIDSFVADTLRAQHHSAPSFRQ